MLDHIFLFYVNDSLRGLYAVIEYKVDKKKKLNSEFAIKKKYNNCNNNKDNIAQKSAYLSLFISGIWLKQNVKGTFTKLAKR